VAPSEGTRNVVSLSGHLDLVCAARAGGSTYIAAQSFAAPFHLSKAYWNDGILLVHVVNQTAGYFGGDTLAVRATVESGASVLLSSPSAARFHPSSGREVRLDQRFEVRAGGFLDVFPEITIPQRDFRARQDTQIHLDPGGEMLFLETLAPGRVASGETFAFDRFSWRTDVQLGGKLIHRERATLESKGKGLAGLRAFGPAGYYAGLLVISPKTETWTAETAREIAALGEGLSAHLGASRLSAGGWSVRVLAEDALALRAVLARVRAYVYQRLDRPLPGVRRY